MEYNFSEFAVFRLVTLQKLHSDAEKILSIFQKFSQQLFLRTTLRSRYHV